MFFTTRYWIAVHIGKRYAAVHIVTSETIDHSFNGCDSAFVQNQVAR